MIVLFSIRRILNAKSFLRNSLLSVGEGWRKGEGEGGRKGAGGGGGGREIHAYWEGVR